MIERGIDVFADVFTISISTADHVIPLLEGINEDINVVAPVTNSLFNRTLLEESDENVCKLFLEGCYLYQIDRIFKLSDFVDIPEIEVELQQIFWFILIEIPNPFLECFLQIELEHDF